MIFEKKNYIQASGEFFTAVQSGGVFKDSKTFVDSVPKIPPEQIENLYKEEKAEHNFKLGAYNFI